MPRPLWAGDDHTTQARWSRYHQWINAGDPAYIPVMQIFREYELAGIELDEASARIAVQLGRSRSQQIAEERERQDREWREHLEERRASVSLPADDENGVVYYIRRGDLIKIGTTNQLQKRMTALRPDELLAFEPGSYSLERERHHQFRDTRVHPRGEYFRPSSELTSHMIALRAEHGVPDQSLLKVTDGRRFFKEKRT